MGPLRNDGEFQMHYARVPFRGTPFMVVTAYLNYVSLGRLGDSAGTAVATLKRYEFLDDTGLLQEQLLSDLRGSTASMCQSWMSSKNSPGNCQQHPSSRLTRLPTRSLDLHRCA